MRKWLSFWMFFLMVAVCSLRVAFADDAPSTAAKKTSAEPTATQAAPILFPFWLSTVMENEPVLFMTKITSATPQASLLFKPTKILAVHDLSGKTTYEEGRDYRWIPGTNRIELPVGSRIVFKTPQDLRRPAHTQAAALTRRDGNGEIFHAEGHVYQDMQTLITYEHPKDSWRGLAPAFAGDRLPHTLDKLTAKKPLKIALLGDSISVGCNATAWVKTAPFQPPYFDLLVQNLKAVYGGEVRLKNFAVGGTTADWGLKNVNAVIEAKPDLVILAFGMNDASGRPERDYQSDMAGMIHAIGKALPEGEIILVATSLGNAEWAAMHMELFPRYRNALLQLCRPGVVVADMTSMWEEFLKHKCYYDLTANGVNHPNDFGHRVYAEVLSSLLIPCNNWTFANY
jgi:lysophospholipase L1-like esterase